MILVEFSMSPLGKGESVSEYVAESLRLIHESGLDYELHAMGTIVEGEWDEVFGLIRQCFESMKQRCPRITCSIKLDYREGAKGRIQGKVASVQARLGITLRTAEHPHS